ncbi:SHSP domain-containing protein [Trichostrongylus colubriformis]|uniref:SHSP domain-containing protein n=1 Tax=Trichostrongylus colubriformis TaxID=6319 RepID=A0AAN8F3D1_TRICO
MDLWPRSFHRMMSDYMREFDRLERSLHPYWRDADHSVLHVANETQKVVDDDKKFAVAVDVSQFHPEELKPKQWGIEMKNTVVSPMHGEQELLGVWDKYAPAL